MILLMAICRPSWQYQVAQKSSKSQKAAMLCDRTGLTRLLEGFTKSPSLIVLTYHRIGDPASCPYDPNLISATPEAFGEQVSFLKSRCHVASLAEVRELVLRPSRWRHSAVLLTFDDGYIDNYTIAYPILRSHGLEGLFFLPTSFVGTRHLPWWDHIAYLIRHTDRRRLSLRYPLPVDLDLSREDVGRSIRRATELCKSPGTTSSARFVTLLAEACDVPLLEEAPERLFLDWSEAAEMARHGMTFGSHTHHHELLTTLSEEEEYAEVSGSRDLLRSRLGGEVSAIAYPVGSRTSFSQRTLSNVQRAGYELGFSFYGGVNLSSNIKPFDLRRVNVGPELSLQLFRLQLLAWALAGRRPFRSLADKGGV